MFSRGIRAIKINDNITAVALKPDGVSPIERARQLLSSDKEPLWLSCTPAGEILVATELEDSTDIPFTHIDDLAILTVYGVCMNTVAKKLERTMREAGVQIYGISLCDIASAFLIDTKSAGAAMSALRSHFTLEL